MPDFPLQFDTLPGDLSMIDVLICVGAAMPCGIMTGWEWESHGKPAGLRTNTLICRVPACT